MPPLSPSLLTRTRETLGGANLPACDSRSLLLTRYAAPLPGQERKPALEKILNSPSHPESVQSYRAWNRTLPAAIHLHARLEARLLVNVGGTVIENAGLALDRYGNPFIPGSAVKACARRAALATLRQWCETGEKPTGADELLAIAAKPLATPGDLLLAILRVFGCTDLEWRNYNDNDDTGNDLAWACGDDLPAERNQWPTLREQARAALLSAIGYPPSAMRDAVAPSLRGPIAFLPASPFSAPKPDLELDVLTPHHKDYYESENPAAVAYDTEDPVPVYFPAIAAETVFTFTLLPLGKADPKLVSQARAWLLTGFTTFGLGAKTNAGYGWFTDATAEIAAREQREADAKRQAEAAAAAKAQHEARLAARKAREAARATMTPDQLADADFAEIVPDWGKLKTHLARFADTKAPLTDSQKAVVLRWFNADGRALWLEQIKTGQGKPKDREVWKRIIGPIHAAKKALKIELP